jgi:putative inorganic carbon (hco3(-)) transporter
MKKPSSRSLATPVSETVSLSQSVNLDDQSKPGLLKPKVRRRLMITAYAGVLLFSVVYFFRPEDMVPALGHIPLAKITGAITALALIAELLSGRVHLNTEVKLLLAYYGYLCLGIPTSAWVGGSFDVVVNQFSKVILMVIATLYAVTDLQRLRSLLLVQTCAMVFLGLLSHGQALQGGRMFGYGQMFGDPNDLALNMCIVLPFCVAFLLTARRWLSKVLWMGAIASLVLAIFSTYSRGGFLALIAVLLSMAIRFKVRAGTIVTLGVLMLCLCTVSILVVGKTSYFDRLRTITDPQADKTGSAQARQKLLFRSLEESLRHPFFGVGPGQFILFSGDWHETHNSYTELTSESGIPALVLFILLMRRTFRNLRISQALTKRDQVWYFSGALYSSLVAYMVGAFFLSAVYWLIPYLLMAYGYALRKMAERLRAQRAHPLINSSSPRRIQEESTEWSTC